MGRTMLKMKVGYQFKYYNLKNNELVWATAMGLNYHPQSLFKLVSSLQYRPGH